MDALDDGRAAEALAILDEIRTALGKTNPRLQAALVRASAAAGLHERALAEHARWVELQVRDDRVNAELQALADASRRAIEARAREEREARERELAQRQAEIEARQREEERRKQLAIEEVKQRERSAALAAELERQRVIAEEQERTRRADAAESELKERIASYRRVYVHVSGGIGVYSTSTMFFPVDLSVAAVGEIPLTRDAKDSRPRVALDFGLQGQIGYMLSFDTIEQPFRARGRLDGRLRFGPVAILGGVRAEQMVATFDGNRELSIKSFDPVIGLVLNGILGSTEPGPVAEITWMPPNDDNGAVNIELSICGELGILLCPGGGYFERRGDFREIWQLRIGAGAYF